MNLKEIANLIGGTVRGDESVEIQDVRSIEDAGEGHITFLSKPKYLEALSRSRASAAIVQKEVDIGKAQVIVANPVLGFARLLAHFHPASRPKPGVDPRAALGENVKLGKNVVVSAFVSLGSGVTIGDETVLYPGAVVGDGCGVGNHCVLHPNVVLYPGTVVGNHVVLHAGAVIGADGFGYTPDEQGRHFKIIQIGRVEIGDHVEVGANTCIDRANLGVTSIGEGTKIDNLAQIGHNCSVGPHSIIVSQAGIAGSCALGHHVVVGGQVGIADHVTVGDNASLMSQTGIFRDVESGAIYGGSPGVPHREYGKQTALIQRLPELADKIKALEKRLNAIEKK
ncbi:MAG: UDP-3-O-(3-hydroxymyristoyl)glucosamine N-acyltransferase [Nitrospinae bacterium]|nr:UDP-3-O-(3-hydroxymyristoyl)glucosamine N-acyltransferase [Nitrospinota bacterium]